MLCKKRKSAKKLVKTYKKKKVTDFTAKKLLVKVVENGKIVYSLPKIEDIREYTKQQLATIWDEVKRFENPHEYYVDLSKQLWDLKQKLLDDNYI